MGWLKNLFQDKKMEEVIISIPKTEIVDTVKIYDFVAEIVVKENQSAFHYLQAALILNNWKQGFYHLTAEKQYSDVGLHDDWKFDWPVSRWYSLEESLRYELKVVESKNTNVPREQRISSFNSNNWDIVFELIRHGAPTHSSVEEKLGFCGWKKGDTIRSYGNGNSNSNDYKFIGIDTEKQKVYLSSDNKIGKWGYTEIGYCRNISVDERNFEKAQKELLESCEQLTTNFDEEGYFKCSGQ